jgi:hypothetical protein
LSLEDRGTSGTRLLEPRAAIAEYSDPLRRPPALPLSSDEVSVIHRWRVDAVLDVVRNGRTRALVLQCRREDGTRRDLVVKTLDMGDTETGLFCEFFGNVVARVAGLNTPEPSLVHIDFGYGRLINFSGAVRAVGKTVVPGLAVGCTYLRPAPLPPRTDGLSVAQVEEAALIYAFDLLVHHPDRRVDNPNVLMFREHFIAIDFDLTFSVLWEILSAVPVRAPIRPRCRRRRDDEHRRGRLLRQRELLRCSSDASLQASVGSLRRVRFGGVQACAALKTKIFVSRWTSLPVAGRADSANVHEGLRAAKDMLKKIPVHASIL